MEGRALPSPVPRAKLAPYLPCFPFALSCTPSLSLTPTLSRTPFGRGILRAVATGETRRRSPGVMSGGAYSFSPGSSPPSSAGVTLAAAPLSAGEGWFIRKSLSSAHSSPSRESPRRGDKGNHSAPGAWVLLVTAAPSVLLLLVSCTWGSTALIFSLPPPSPKALLPLLVTMACLRQGSVLFLLP